MGFFNTKNQLGIQPMYGVGGLAWLLELHRNSIVPGMVWSRPMEKNLYLNNEEWKFFFNTTNEIIISVNAGDLRHVEFQKWALRYRPRYLEICNGLNQDVPEIGKNDADIDTLKLFKDAGIKIFPKCFNNNSSEFIEKIVDHMDAINVKNKDAAGYTSNQTLGDSITWAKKFGKPILASGGISNRHKVKQAFDLGADSVMMGTIFACTQESNLSYKAKLLMIKKNSQDINHYGIFNQRALGDGYILEDDDGNMNRNYSSLSKEGKSGIVFVGNAIDHIDRIQTIEEVATSLRSG